MGATLLHGVDFTSAPSRRKPITVADGRPRTEGGGAVLGVERIHALPDLDAFDSWLRRPCPLLAACDFPFSLPRPLLADIGCPVVGDSTYGAKSNPIRRVALHAASLRIKHPTTGETMTLQSPLPAEMAKLMPSEV